MHREATVIILDKTKPGILCIITLFFAESGKTFDSVSDQITQEEIDEEEKHEEEEEWKEEEEIKKRKCVRVY